MWKRRDVLVKVGQRAQVKQLVVHVHCHAVGIVQVVQKHEFGIWVIDGKAVSLVRGKGHVEALFFKSLLSWIVNGEGGV